MQRERPALVPLLTRSITWLEQQAVADDSFGWQHNQAVTNFDFYVYACADLCLLVEMWISVLKLDLTSRAWILSPLLGSNAVLGGQAGGGAQEQVQRSS
jgi:hypothetical protein